MSLSFFWFQIAFLFPKEEATSRANFFTRLLMEFVRGWTAGTSGISSANEGSTSPTYKTLNTSAVALILTGHS